MTQVARMKKGHSFELMSGERRGNTTAPNRSTAIRTRLWIDTPMQTSVENETSLHKAWPRGPLISQESAWISVKAHGKLETVDRTWPCVGLKSWLFFSCFSSCRQLLRWKNSQPARKQGSGSKQTFFRSFLLWNYLHWNTSIAVYYSKLC